MTAEELCLELRVPVEPVPLGEDVVVHVVLTNRGTELLLVNGRLLVGAPHAPEPFREVTFEVDGPRGYVNRTLRHVNAGTPASKHFVELWPGDDIVKSFTLTELEDMSVSGAYVVRATYANTVVDATLPRRPWTGRISSAWEPLERAPAD
jgi:hypothetical protein